MTSLHTIRLAHAARSASKSPLHGKKSSAAQARAVKAKATVERQQKTRGVKAKKG